MSWKKVLLEGDAATLSDNTPNTIEPDDTALAGTGISAARDDHEHAIVAAVAGTIGESDSPAEGIATSFSRSDHLHGSPASWTPALHEASHKSGGGDEILLHEFGVPTAAVAFNKQQATGLALDVQTTAPATPVNGQVYYNDTDDHPYVYVA